MPPTFPPARADGARGTRATPSGIRYKAWTAALAAAALALTGCTGGSHDTHKTTVTPTPSPTPSFSTSVSDPPSVAEAFYPATWQVDEKQAGKAVGVLRDGGLLLDDDGELTALSSKGKVEWTADGRGKIAGDGASMQHQDTILLNGGAVAASYDTFATHKDSTLRMGATVTLVNTDDGAVIRRVRLDGLASSPVKRLSANGLGFLGVAGKDDRQAHGVIVQADGVVKQVPGEFNALVGEHPVDLGAGGGDLKSPGWLVTVLKRQHVDPTQVRAVLGVSPDLAVVRAEAASRGEPDRLFLARFSTRRAEAVPPCFVAGGPTLPTVSPNGKVIGFYGLLANTDGGGRCLEDGGKPTTILTVLDSGTAYAKHGKQLVTVTSNGKTNGEKLPKALPIGSANGMIYNATQTNTGTRIITANRLPDGQ